MIHESIKMAFREQGLDDLYHLDDESNMITGYGLSVKIHPYNNSLSGYLLLNGINRPINAVWRSDHFEISKNCDDLVIEGDIHPLYGEILSRDVPENLLKLLGIRYFRLTFS